MHIINGTIDPKINPLDFTTAEQPVTPALRKVPPAKELFDGQVVTRIWANRNPWGEISWKVDQVRGGHYSGGRQTRKGLYFDNLQDAMRGLYRAKRWIARTERRRNRNWFWWW